MTPSKESKLSYSVMLRPGPEPQPPQRRRQRNRRFLVTHTHTKKKELAHDRLFFLCRSFFLWNSWKQHWGMRHSLPKRAFRVRFPQLEAESRRIPANLCLTQLQKYYLREAPAISQGTHKMLPCHDLRHCIKFVQP